jgi:hypothetical protein
MAEGVKGLNVVRQHQSQNKRNTHLVSRNKPVFCGLCKLSVGVGRNTLRERLELIVER